MSDQPVLFAQDLSGEMSEAEYDRCIPACCSYQGIGQHMEMMLCWGLLRSIERGQTHHCGKCDVRWGGNLARSRPTIVLAQIEDGARGEG